MQAQISEAKAARFDLEMVAVKASQFEKDLESVRRRLQKERPDLFIIGFGIRGSPELTAFFERLINTCRETSPSTKIGFNVAFDGNLEVCERVLGKQKAESFQHEIV